jgi:biopolymer transport protein ExbD/biopolymer transport protein TolR
MAISIGTLRARRGGASPNINVTPLVDVVLVVLIIFMLVTPMMTKTFWLNLPPKDLDQKAATPASANDNKPVVMTVDAKGAIFVNRVALTRAEIEERLPRVMAGAGQRVLYFDASDEAPYAAAVEAMDLSRASGVRSIAILTSKVAK